MSASATPSSAGHETLKGIIFNVQRYSLHDGPGIRTVVFLKGCPLRCLWCCNPESQRLVPEMEFVERKCQRCGRCLFACPRGAINPDLGLTAATKINRALCDDCGRCAEACPNGALRLVGEERSVDEVTAEVLRDAAAYRRSGGGVTLSGGEPLVQAAFARALLEACYERNVHTAVETSGSVNWSLYQGILPFTDLFLFDLKHMSGKAHRRLTGISNRQILDNARRLARAGVDMILRVPLIPDHNLSEENLRAVADFAADLGVPEVHLMPFHQLGKEKYGRIGSAYSLGELAGLRDTPEGQQRIRWAQEIMSARGLRTFVGG